MESLKNLLKSRHDLQTLFPEQLPHDEVLVEDYSCAIFKEILVHGRMYITKNFIAFKSNILGIKTSEIIPLDEVESVVKSHFAYLFDNAIEITTVTGKKFTFASFAHRDQAFRTLESLWSTCKSLMKCGLKQPGRSLISKSPQFPFASPSKNSSHTDKEPPLPGFALSEELHHSQPDNNDQKERFWRNNKADMNTSSEKVEMSFPCRIPSLPSVSNSLVLGELANCSSSDMSEVSQQYRSDSIDEVSISRDASTIAEDASQVAELGAEDHHSPPPPPPVNEPSPRKANSSEAQFETINIPPSADRSAERTKSSSSPAKTINPEPKTLSTDSDATDQVVAKLGGKLGGEYCKRTTEMISEGRVDCHQASFPCHITFFWHTFWGPDSNFLQSLHKRRKDSELAIGKWKKKDAGVLQRELRWIGPVSSPIGPKSTKVTCEETCHIFSEQEFVMDTLTATHDVPYGDRFQVEVRYHVQSTADGCDMKVYMRMIFHRNVWIKGVLEKGALKGTQEYCQVWEEVAQEFIDQVGPKAKSPRLVPVREVGMVKEKVKDKEKKSTGAGGAGGAGDGKLNVKERVNDSPQAKQSASKGTKSIEEKSISGTEKMSKDDEKDQKGSWMMLPVKVDDWMALMLILAVFLLFIFLFVAYLSVSSRLSSLEREVFILKHGSHPLGNH